jgi:hypothetical protein
MPADQPGAEPPRSARFSAAIRALRWGNVRRHPGAVTAGIAIVLWIVAAVGVTLLVLTRR